MCPVRVFPFGLVGFLVRKSFVIGGPVEKKLFAWDRVPVQSSFAIRVRGSLEQADGAAFSVAAEHAEHADARVRGRRDVGAGADERRLRWDRLRSHVRARRGFHLRRPRRSARFGALPEVREVHHRVKRRAFGLELEPAHPVRPVHRLQDRGDILGCGEKVDLRGCRRERVLDDRRGRSREREQCFGILARDPCPGLRVEVPVVDQHRPTVGQWQRPFGQFGEVGSLHVSYEEPSQALVMSIAPAPVSQRSEVTFQDSMTFGTIASNDSLKNS